MWNIASLRWSKSYHVWTQPKRALLKHNSEATIHDDRLTIPTVLPSVFDTPGNALSSSTAKTPVNTIAQQWTVQQPAVRPHTGALLKVSSQKSKGRTTRMRRPRANIVSIVLMSEEDRLECLLEQGRNETRAFQAQIHGREDICKAKVALKNAQKHLQRCEKKQKDLDEAVCNLAVETDTSS